MAYYKDLREYVKALEANNKLIRIRREINKDTELMPLVRWQFRGLPEEERKAFLFENVTDANGKRYKSPVLVASCAASTEIYAIGVMSEPGKIMQKLTEAQLHPVKPKIVKDGPVHEEVHQGGNLLQHGGLDEFPTPISTPGFDNAPYLTSACLVSKDPETGIRNIGVYRNMLKSQTRMGISAPPPQHFSIHWEKSRRLGKPLQAAAFIGSSPSLAYASVTKIPYGIDEYNVAGGIAGEPIELVRCKTVDIEVPATAEIVIEGEVPTDSVEREGPFGEYTGYLGVERQMMPYFNVSCITHRRDAITHAFFSQFPPSESSKIRAIGDEASLYKFLRNDCGLPVLDVALPESCGSLPYCVIKIKKAFPAQAWQALNGAITQAAWRKIVIVVDEDIDARDADSVNWALAFRVQPHRDVRIVQGMIGALDPSVGPPPESEEYPLPSGASAMLIDATRNWDYPPMSLPKKQFMERARQIWEEEGLPNLRPKEPWHGYTLGFWTKENEEEAELALKGEHYQTGEKLAKLRVKS